MVLLRRPRRSFDTDAATPARRRRGLAFVTIAAAAVTAACGTTAPFTNAQTGARIYGSGTSGSGSAGAAGGSAAGGGSLTGAGAGGSDGSVDSSGGQAAGTDSSGGGTAADPSAAGTGSSGAGGNTQLAGGGPAAPGATTLPGQGGSLPGAAVSKGPFSSLTSPSPGSGPASAKPGSGTVSSKAPGSKTATPVAPKPGAAKSSAATTKTGTAGGGTGTSGGSGGGATSPANSIPDTGPGWDKGTIYIGYTLETDTQTVGSTIGAGAFDFGDQKADAQAVTDYVNKAGSEYGRKVSGVSYDVSTTGDPAQEATEACALWTQDKRVALVLLSIARLNTLQMYDCLARAHIPTIIYGQTPSAAADLAPFAPYLIQPNAIYFDRLAPVWVNRLKANGYFGGWNTTAGAADPTSKVKVGIVYGATPQADHAWGLLAQAVKAAGYGDADVQTYDPTSVDGFSQIAVKLRSDGVTHVFMDTNAGLFYPPAAQAQSFFARYGVYSPDLLQPIVTGSNAAQLKGAMGIGWIPTIDVDQAHDPGPQAGFNSCIKILQDAGADMSKRNYQFAGSVVCDEFFLGVKGILAGGGLDSDSILKGIRSTAPTYPWAIQFAAGQNAATQDDLTTAVRDVQYDAGCSCFDYISTTNQQVP